MNKTDEVVIQATYPLSGTLTIPIDSNPAFPAILIISGSGKGDRDGNLKKMKINIYKDLADFLTLKGFVTLRYDKRGTSKSGGNFLETGLTDLIDDAVECIKFLRSHPKVDNNKIIILGHSEGALIAPAVFKKISVSGLILLAGAAEPSKELLPRQNELAYAELNRKTGIKGWLIRTFKITEKARKQNSKIINKIIHSDKEVMRLKGVKLNAKWLREIYAYNVCEYLAEVTCPVLAITGEKDIQVPPEHAKLMAEMVKGEAEWHTIPDMNHIFRKYEGQHTMLGLLKEYKTQINQPIDKELLDRLSTWLQGYTK
ncbi:alpha/beta hydrolase family protein [Cytobacillus praedii]|uniref:Alpha/beta fold hydrolase n=1 Tax=Cytobacillus praedii TaxID=1742358 RepID=A0A4R1AWI8_9BACI|nr:alpha/beta hydrolase [Cytobacillus praedii]TCJ02598.1 alpha/beta fold hydrolase [Cytobacillus praedii]